MSNLNLGRFFPNDEVSTLAVVAEGRTGRAIVHALASH
jgi:hypothetical protein